MLPIFSVWFVFFPLTYTTKPVVNWLQGAAVNPPCQGFACFPANQGFSSFMICLHPQETNKKKCYLVCSFEDVLISIRTAFKSEVLLNAIAAEVKGGLYFLKPQDPWQGLSVTLPFQGRVGSHSAAFACAEPSTREVWAWTLSPTSQVLLNCSQVLLFFHVWHSLINNSLPFGLSWYWRR